MSALKHVVLGMLLLALLLAACGGDDDKDKKDNDDKGAPAAELSQEITTFNGALTFKLPADATFDGSQVEQARFGQITLKSGVKAYVAWGPLSAGLTPDADGLLSTFKSGGGKMSNVEKFEINGSPAVKAEGDYSDSGMGYGYVLGVLTNGQTIMLTFSASDKDAFAKDKATILAIVDSVSVDGSKLG